MTCLARPPVAAGAGAPCDGVAGGDTFAAAHLGVAGWEAVWVVDKATATGAAALVGIELRRAHVACLASPLAAAAA